jgi:hypothetical protein
MKPPELLLSFSPIMRKTIHTALSRYTVAAMTFSQIHALQGDQWRNEVINGPKWSFTSPQADPCNDQNRVWQGITCSSLPNICKFQSCEIISLTLRNSNLKGTLPAEFFLQHVSLTSLEISFSPGLVGTIPSEISSLSQLSSLFLSINQLTGVLPSEISCLSQLGFLNLYDNELTGPIPSEIGSLSLLSSLFLRDNHFTGTIPSQIGSLSQLTLLNFHNNLLTGTIPREIG